MRWLLAIALAACAPRVTRIVVVRELCESRFEQPATACARDLELAFDGCRWACRLQQKPAATPSGLELGPDIQAVQRMDLCVTPTCNSDHEGK